MKTEEDPAFEFSEWVVKNRVFILGAGFSAAGGIPMTSDLLGRTMDNMRRECPGVFSSIESRIRAVFNLHGKIHFSCLDFSAFCTHLSFLELSEFGGGDRWSDSGSREILVFKYYLARTILELTPTSKNMPQLYVDFASQLRLFDYVMTFNWDCLLENALERARKPFSYISQKNHNLLHKMHGSINWRLNLPQNNRCAWIPLRFTDYLMENDIYYCDELRDLDRWNAICPQSLGEIQPFLVLPGYGKAHDVRPLAPLWYRPGMIFRYTHDIFFIGLSLSFDDFFIRSYIFSTLPYVEAASGVRGRRIVVINPDPEARAFYSDIMDLPNTRFIEEPFQESHLRLINEVR